MDKKLTNKRPLIRWIAIISCIIVVSVTIAFMFKKTDPVQNLFIPGDVECDVEEAFADNEKSSVKIKNTGTITEYLRLKMISYWVDADGNIVGKASKMPAVSYDSSKWIKSETSDTYYCKNVVQAGESTPELLSTGTTIVLTTAQHNGVDVYQVVEIFAEAIQAEPTSAVTGSWKVTVDGSGNITTVP